MAQPEHCLIGLLVMLTVPRVKQAYPMGRKPTSFSADVQLLGIKSTTNLFPCLLSICSRVFSFILPQHRKFGKMMSITLFHWGQNATAKGYAARSKHTPSGMEWMPAWILLNSYFKILTSNGMELGSGILRGNWFTKTKSSQMRVLVLGKIGPKELVRRTRK